MARLTADLGASMEAYAASTERREEDLCSTKVGLPFCLPLLLPPQPPLLPLPPQPPLLPLPTLPTAKQGGGDGGFW